MRNRELSLLQWGYNIDSLFESRFFSKAYIVSESEKVLSFDSSETIVRIVASAAEAYKI